MFTRSIYRPATSSHLHVMLYILLLTTGVSAFGISFDQHPCNLQPKSVISPCSKSAGRYMNVLRDFFAHFPAGDPGISIGIALRTRKFSEKLMNLLLQQNGCLSCADDYAYTTNASVLQGPEV